VSKNYVLRALNVLPLLLERPEQYKIILKGRAGNPEMILRKSWKLQNIKHRHRSFERMMFTCGESGDMTRWMELGELVEEGVRLKYASEYNESHIYCNLQLNRPNSSASNDQSSDGNREKPESPYDGSDEIIVPDRTV
jgi:hypothetical protein